MKYLKYIILVFIFILVPCVLTVLIYNDKITQNAPQYYRQGVKFYNEGDYQNAYYNFGRIKWFSPLYKLALYKQAKSAQKAGDYKTAAVKYKMFLEKMPNSIFDLKAKLNLGKSYYYSKQYDEAKSIFESLKQKSNNSATEEVYYLGLIEKNTNKEKAALYFREYLRTALYGTALNNKFILSVAQELSSLEINLTEEDKLLLGVAYFKKDKYKKSLEYLSKLPVDKCWDYLVLANYYTGSKSIAKKLMETGLESYSSTADSDNLNKIYSIYTYNLKGSKLKNWMQLHNIVKQNKLKCEDYILYKIAQILSEEKAIEYYNQIVQNYPESNYAPESLWNIFWNKYKKKDYKNAEVLAIRHLKTYKNVKSRPKVAFWLGKTYMRENKFNDAHSTFSKLIAKYPDNYYGLRAAEILEKKNDFWSTSPNNKIPEQKEDIEFPISISDLEIKDLKLINTLFEMGDDEIWIDADFSNPIVESWFEAKKNNKSKSIVLARDEIEKMDTKPPFISSSYKLAYPRYWVSEINISGQKLNLDPFLILSLMKEESYFNEHAKSSTGATGLMQIMPDTANYIILKLLNQDSNLADLEDPRTNMYLGCTYLKYLKDKFGNDLYVIAAYNGGEGSLNKWLKQYNTADNDEFIEQIPYEETKNYIKKVFRTYHMYKKIYK